MSVPHAPSGCPPAAAPLLLVLGLAGTFAAVYCNTGNRFRKD